MAALGTLRMRFGDVVALGTPLATVWGHDRVAWGDPLCPVDASWGCGGCFGDTPPSTALGTQGYGNASWRYLHGRSVQVTKEEEWLWFDVTDVVKQWLSSSGKSGGGGVSSPCLPLPNPMLRDPPWPFSPPPAIPQSPWACSS